VVAVVAAVVAAALERFVFDPEAGEGGELAGPEAEMVVAV